MSHKDAVRSAITSAVLAASIATAAADETSIRLTEGPGLTQVQASCSMCHSLDYILMNSPFQDKAAWEKTVNKMVKVMGAPLTADDVTAVVAYLDSHYGKGRARGALTSQRPAWRGQLGCASAPNRPFSTAPRRAPS